MWLARVAQGDFDFVILSPPCGSWSRANWADDKWPQPCRDRANPWGFPQNSRTQRRRATQGNEFIHFSIRALELVKDAKTKGFRVRCLLEHLEDLGRTHRGCPASIWQLSEIRAIGNSQGFVCVAGHQCQYEGVDRKKPTRLLSDLSAVAGFGSVGCPTFDAGDWYKGPLPHNCGHNHKEQMIGKTDAGGYHTSKTAAYPDGMCAFLAKIIFEDWHSSIKQSSCGEGNPKRERLFTKVDFISPELVKKESDRMEMISVVVPSRMGWRSTSSCPRTSPSQRTRHHRMSRNYRGHGGPAEAKAGGALARRYNL